jgi:hypothetical protein
MRLFVALLFSILLLTPAVALPAAAHAAADVVAQQQDEPAVVIPDTEPAPEERAWTFRFLVPALLVAALALVAVTVYKYRDLNRRYRVTE